MQESVERVSAQAEGLCRLARIAIIASQRLFYQECLYFFKTHVLEIARFDGAGRQTQIARSDLSILRHKHRALDDVIELANISGERMLQQTLSCSFIETANRFPITLCVLTNEAVGQQHDVLPPLTQSRQRDLNCIQAKQ